MPLHLFKPPAREGDAAGELAELVDQIEVAGEHVTSTAWMGDKLAIFTASDSQGIIMGGAAG